MESQSEKNLYDRRKNAPKCHFCRRCDGFGCISEIPGMGGVFKNANFIENCKAWKRYKPTTNDLPSLRLAPITGAVENVGWRDEESFYPQILKASHLAGISLSIGDGTPDKKFFAGVIALRELKSKAAIFIKPYPEKVFFKRLELAEDVAEIFGIDIDAYNIVTMRELVKLEKKTPTQLLKIKSHTKKPFALKGVFTKEDLETVSKVKPDIVVVSNHGGRIETQLGSTADFLAKNFTYLKKYCGEVWVDGGLREQNDLLVARSLGASTCMIGRPVITALLREGSKGVTELIQKFNGAKPKNN